MVISWGGGSDVAHGSCWPWLGGWFARVQLTLHARVCTIAGGLHCQWYAVEHSNSGKKVSIRFGNLINLPLVH